MEVSRRENVGLEALQTERRGIKRERKHVEASQRG